MYRCTDRFSAGNGLQVADLGLALVLAVDCDELQSGIHGTVSHMVSLRMCVTLACNFDYDANMCMYSNPAVSHLLDPLSS
jgi:hypothetical protein